MNTEIAARHHEPWNKGKLTGQKAPLRLQDIWAIRVRLQLGNHPRDLALFNLAIDSKLRACDLMNLRVNNYEWRINCFIVGDRTCRNCDPYSFCRFTPTKIRLFLTV